MAVITATMFGGESGPGLQDHNIPSLHAHSIPAVLKSKSAAHQCSSEIHSHECMQFNVHACTHTCAYAQALPSVSMHTGPCLPSSPLLTSPHLSPPPPQGSKMPASPTGAWESPKKWTNTFCFVLFFKTGFLCVALLPALELALVELTEIPLPLPPKCHYHPAGPRLLNKDIPNVPGADSSIRSKNQAPRRSSDC